MGPLAGSAMGFPYELPCSLYALQNHLAQTKDWVEPRTVSLNYHPTRQASWASLSPSLESLWAGPGQRGLEEVAGKDGWAVWHVNSKGTMQERERSELKSMRGLGQREVVGRGAPELWSSGLPVGVWGAVKKQSQPSPSGSGLLLSSSVGGIPVPHSQAVNYWSRAYEVLDDCVLRTAPK